jgi:hypothetical protein
VQTLNEMRPSVLFAGPAHIGPCLQQRMFEELDLSALRIAVLSGTTVSPALSAAFEALLPHDRAAVRRLQPGDR